MIHLSRRGIDQAVQELVGVTTMQEASGQRAATQPHGEDEVAAAIDVDDRASDSP